MRWRTVDVDGPLHFADFGGRGPTMVLVHGLGGSHANWLAVAPALAAHARVLVPDLPGFGRTPLAGRSADVVGARAILDRFLDAVTDAPVMLVGNSLGGFLAMVQAARCPEKVDRLVLAAPAQPWPVGTWIDPVVALGFMACALPLVGETLMRWDAARLGPEGLVRRTMALCCADPARLAPDVLAAHVAMARERHAAPWAHAAFLAAARSSMAMLARRWEVRTILEAITAPTLLIHGTRDRLVPLAASRATVAQRPDWSLTVFEDVGHVPQLEAPERFVATVLGWLDDGNRDAPARRSARATRRSPSAAK